MVPKMPQHSETQQLLRSVILVRTQHNVKMSILFALNKAIPNLVTAGTCTMNIYTLKYTLNASMWIIL